MNPYHKIETVWARDPETKFRTLIEGQWATPEFEYLADNKWVWTEKVDGTNIRITVNDGEVILGGRTDNAQLPAHLVSTLQAIGDNAAVALDMNFTLYGEGYGAKIQKGGGNYIADGSDFVLFDVKVGDVWLQRENVEDIANKLGLRVVPIVGVGSLHEAIMMTRGGFDSTWGAFRAEGLVMRPAVELQTRLGRRVITKIKTKDFT